MILSIEHSFEGDQHSVTIQTDEAQSKGTPNLFAFSLSSDDQERLRWYWEDFLQYPREAALDEAQEAERRIDDIGADLFGKIFASGAAQAIWRRVKPRLASTRIEITTPSSQGSGDLPWELIRDPAGGVLATEAQAFVRVPQAGEKVVPTRPQGAQLRVLCVICRPPAESGTPFRSTAGLLLRSLAPPLRKRVQLEFLRPPTFGQLSSTLLEAEAMSEPYHVLHVDCCGVFADVELDGTPDEVALFEHEPQFSQVLRGPHGYLVFQDATLEQNFHLVDGVSLAELLADARVPLLTLCSTPASADKFSLEPRDFDEDPTTTQQALLSVAHDASARGLSGALCLPYGLDPICASEMTGKIYNELVQGRSLGESVARVRRQGRDITDRQVTYGPIAFRDGAVPVAYEREPAAVVSAAKAKGESAVPLQVLDAAASRETQAIDSPTVPVGGFIRRDALLMRLDHAFDNYSIVLLEGDPGQGKTALAAEFARWYTRTGGNDGPVMYTSFDHRISLASVLDQLARVFHSALEESGHDWNRVDPEERLEVILHVLNQIPCFWIWDNVEAVEPATGESEWAAGEREELTKFLRSARQSQAKFLLASNPAEHRWLGIMPQRVSISGLPPCERLQMTRALLEQDDGRLEDGDDWRPLLDYSEGNPLALACLTTAAVKEDIDNAAGLRALRGRVVAAGPEEGAGVLQAALRYSVQKELGDNDRRMMGLLHLFRGTVHVDRLAALATGPADAALPHLKKNRAFVELSDDPESTVLDRAARLHLLRRRAEGEFIMHPTLPPLLDSLFQTAITSDPQSQAKKRSLFDALRSRARQSEGGEESLARRAYVRSFADFGARSFERLKTGDPDVEAELAVEEANLSHALSLARQNEWFDLIGGCVQGLGALFEVRGEVSAWESFVSELMKECAEHGAETAVAGRDLYWRAVIEQGVNAAARMRHLPRAELLQRLCLHWDQEKAAGFVATSPQEWDDEASRVVRRCAESVYRLSDLLRKQGFPEPKIDQEAVDLAQKLGDRETAAQWTFDLGLAYTDELGVRNLDLADRWFQQSLALKDDDDRLGKAACYAELGRVSWEHFGMARKSNMAQVDLMRHLSDARQHYMRAIENDPPDDWVKLAHHNQELGHICFALGDLGRALPYYREAIRYYERQGNMVEAANTRFTLALSLRDGGRLAEARKFAVDAHAGFQKTGGDPEMIGRAKRIVDSIEQRLEQQKRQHQAGRNG